MEKNRLIIIEGPQGTGKTTLANYLRENIASSDLLRLSGQKDKTEKGKQLSERRFFALLDYLYQMESIPVDIIFDRTFFTEEIYARLGYKEYTFTDVFNKLMRELLELEFDIYYFTLYLKKTELYRERLARDSHHNYQAFSIENSANQQHEYLKLAEELKYFESENFHIIPLAMDNFTESYEEVNKLLKIK